MSNDTTVVDPQAADVTPPVTPPPVTPPPALPPMSFAEATSRKAEFFADKGKMDSLMQGAVEATEEWRRITEGLSAQPETPTGPREVETKHLNAIAGYNLPQDVLNEFRENRPVSPAERRFAQAKLDEFKQSAEWFAKYQRGDMLARNEMALVVSILARPVRDPETQP